ncbi:serine/threonine-protein kinase [Streptomyces shenzhenensis]|uniref:non-specific serine/threonine protein kinase n=1 Tax=Streptomyces shenzhenensis TaxID=943815 RepID=A0A3M0ILQ4_9ACTN|nr:serine/threonine-protein kinase [Streptomyces shenzhenensis]RMB87883.1 serine/threonine protein kinase [Streptomyces shenzhenensis]
MSEAERAGTSRQDKSGRLLAGRYRLGEVLGRGGMGTVWRAEDETLGRTVAVKELRFPSNIDEDEKRRLITRTLREAKAIARIRNNSAVTVFDVVDEDDRPWIVMELVEGKSLAEVIREDGLLEPKRAAQVGLAILDVLRSAHREGILHRDVKPSNVLIAEDGRVVLTDFGIAQVEGDPSITSTGMLVGAPSYISPERARGHKPGPAADLWSLGGLLYAAVEGVPPYDKGSAIATLTAVMTEPLEEPKNAGPLKDVIHGLLTKDAAKRLDDAGARALLDAVIRAPEREAMDATRVVPLPSQPDGSADRAAAGAGKRGEEAGEKLRGALRSVRKAAGAAAAGAAGRTAGSTEGTAAGAGASAPASGGAASAGAGGNGKGAAGAGSAGAAGTASASAAAGSAAAETGTKSGAAKPSSGWPVVPPPDLPSRPAPRASLTDVVPKRTLVIIAVVLVLAVVGTVLALTLGDGNGSNGAKDDGGKPVASAGASAGTKQNKDSGGTRTDGEASASSGKDAAADATTGSTAGAGSEPSGSGDGGSGESNSSGSGGVPVAQTRKGAQGYSIGLPEGWKYGSSDSAGDRYTGPDGQKLLVAWTSTPKDDPVADWKNQERSMARSQYQRIRIEKVDYRGWNTADWEFTYTEGGTKYRTVDRGFVIDGRVGYALMYTAKSAEWDGELRSGTWKTLTESFEPKA